MPGVRVVEKVAVVAGAVEVHVAGLEEYHTMDCNVSHLRCRIGAVVADDYDAT